MAVGLTTISLAFFGGAPSFAARCWERPLRFQTAPNVTVQPVRGDQLPGFDPPVLGIRTVLGSFSWRRSSVDACLSWLDISITIRGDGFQEGFTRPGPVGGRRFAWINIVLSWEKLSGQRPLHGCSDIDGRNDGHFGFFFFIFFFFFFFFFIFFFFFFFVFFFCFFFFFFFFFFVLRLSMNPANFGRHNHACCVFQ